MRKSSRSSRSASLLPVEEGNEMWAAGLMSCAALCRRSAERMRRGLWPGNWKSEVGAAELLEKLAGLVATGRKCAGKKVQEHSKPGEAVEARRRLSDGKKSDVPRKALVV